MPDLVERISGLERAAIFLLSLGEEQAASILKHMQPKEVQKLGMTMAALTNVPKTRVDTVLGSFVETVQNETGIGIGSQDYIRKMLVSALGEDKASGLIDRIVQGGNTKGLDTLKWMDARAIAELIRLEHPQIIAIVLAYLDGEQSAEIVGELPERLRQDVLMRIATLDGIPPSALNELNEVLEKQFSGRTNMKSTGVGGAKAAANILNFMDSSAESDLIEKIRESDEKLADEIEDLMFVFEDLVDIEDRGFQTLMREVSSDVLAMALKGASDAIKAKVFKNMSQRAAEMLRDDLDAKGPVRLSEVEGAQKEILATARKMSEAGDISLGGKGGEEYV